MASFKITVRGKRDDGFWPVYILVTHKSKIAYIKTDYVVSDKGLKKVYDSKGKETKELSDVKVLRSVLDTIADYVKRLNDVDNSAMTVQEIVAFLSSKDDDLLFTDFSRTYINNMIRDSALWLNEFTTKVIALNAYQLITYINLLK